MCMLLTIRAKNGNFFQKCTHLLYFDPNSLDYNTISVYGGRVLVAEGGYRLNVQA